MMATKQTQVMRQIASSNQETCSVCGKSFSHTSDVDHLFLNKECMRRYWQEEEKTHIYRLRHRVKTISTA